MTDHQRIIWSLRPNKRYVVVCPERCRRQGNQMKSELKRTANQSDELDLGQLSMSIRSLGEPKKESSEQRFDMKDPGLR